MDRKSICWSAKTPVYLCDTLGIGPANVADIRYQLLHRTASAVIEARRFHAAVMMLVHSFSLTHEWFDDFAKFAKLYDVEPMPNAVPKLECRGEIPLFIAWSVGDARYLTR